MKYFLALILFFLISNVLPVAANALTMSNPDYKIDTDTLNINQYNSSSSKNSNEDLLKGAIKGVNYTLENGFPWGDSSQVFNFSVSTSAINFGTLSAGEAITRSVDLNVENEMGYHFVVNAYQDHPLRSKRQIDIPDTTCDNGSCSETISSSWLSPLTYGFGYTCKDKKGFVCDGDFEGGFAFKQLADMEKQERSRIIFSGSSNEAQAELIFKINISGVQEKDIYSNTVFLIALAGF